MLGFAPPKRFRDRAQPFWPPCRPIARANRTGDSLVTPLWPACRPSWGASDRLRALIWCRRVPGAALP